MELAKPLEDLIAEKARRRMSDGGKGASFEATLVTTKEVAKAIGVSKATYERAKKIRDEGTPEEQAKARQKPRSINSAHNDLVKRTKFEELTKKGIPPLPKGQYDIILADPPWEYDLQLRGEPGLHYATMKTAEISALIIPAADNCILFLWATNPKLEDALKTLHAWGFTYKTNMVWVKPVFGTGYYFRGQHELLLVGVKGDTGPPPESVRRSSVLQAPRRKHSEKPDEAYEIIESYYPQSTRLELFARETRPGWASWGAEL